MMITVRGHPGRPARRRGRSSPGRSCPPATCPATGSGRCRSGCTCGCTPARASRPSSGCTCAGAGWPPCAARAGSAAPCRCGCGRCAPGEHSVFLGRAHWRHWLRVPLEEHVLVMAPPRTFKTAFLADVILRYPGPVDRDHHQGRRRGPDRRGPLRSAARCTCSTRSASAASRPRSAGRRSTAARTRRPRSAGRTRSRSRSPRRASRTAPSGRPRPATTCAATSTPPPWPATTCGRSPPGCPAPTPHVPERILAAAGARQWALTLAELRSEAHKTAATVRMVMSRAISFMADPALAASVLPAPGDGFDIARFLPVAGPST